MKCSGEPGGAEPEPVPVPEVVSEEPQAETSKAVGARARTCLRNIPNLRVGCGKVLVAREDSRRNQPAVRLKGGETGAISHAVQNPERDARIP